MIFRLGHAYSDITSDKNTSGYVNLSWTLDIGYRKSKMKFCKCHKALNFERKRKITSDSEGLVDNLF